MMHYRRNACTRTLWTPTSEWGNSDPCLADNMSSRARIADKPCHHCKRAARKAKEKAKKDKKKDREREKKAEKKAKEAKKKAEKS